MRHQRQRYQLSRSASHRKALLLNLAKEIIDHERIQTTEAKAKAVKPELEKLITLAKRGDLHARRQALSALGQDKFAVHGKVSSSSAMRHQRQRYQLSRSASHRKALLMNLSKEVIQHERIQTSEAKAKAVKPEVEKLITLAKRGDLHARRQALSALGQDKFTVYKLFDEIAPRYSERPGGYTRILKLGPRRSDSTEMVLLELV